MVGLYLLVAVEVTSLLVRRLPRSIWLAVHLSSYPLFAMTTAHLLLAGSDVSSPVVRLVVLAAIGEVTFLSAYRTVLAFHDRRLVTTAATTTPKAT